MKGTGIPLYFGDAVKHNFAGTSHVYFFDSVTPKPVLVRIYGNLLDTAGESLRGIASHKMKPKDMKAAFPGRLELVTTLTGISMVGSGSQHACYVYKVVGTAPRSSGLKRKLPAPVPVTVEGMEMEMRKCKRVSKPVQRFTTSSIHPSQA